jgi:hypothetical protein
VADGVRISIAKAPSLQKKLKRIVPEIEKTLQREILEAANEVKAQAITAIEAPKTGRLYRAKRRGSGAFYSWRASAPGEAPARKTGDNLARIKTKKYNRAGKPGAKIVAPNIYRLLERGLAIGARNQVLPRPLFGPLIGAYKKTFKERLDESVRKSLRIVARK